MELNKIKYIINSLLIIVFILSSFTGLIKFPGLLNSIGLNYISLPFYYINLIHDYSGLILLILIIIHLIIHWRWLGSLFSLKIGNFKLWQIIAFFVIGLLIIMTFYLQSDKSSKTRELASREIKEYQGEDLSSVNDLQETSINGIQYINQARYQLEISGLVEQAKKYSYEQVLTFNKYSKVVELNCVTGWTAKILWEGVLLKDVLASAKIKPEAKNVIFYAQDGFTTSLPLDFIIDNDIILAYKVNGIVLPPEKGFPFQLVAEQKWGYKWIKWITKIELSDNLDYQGTYEKVGYSNDGDITGPKREN